MSGSAPFAFAPPLRGLVPSGPPGLDFGFVIFQWAWQLPSHGPSIPEWERPSETGPFNTGAPPPACVLSLQPCPTVCDPWTVARRAPLSVGFSRQEHCSGLPCPPPGDPPDLGIQPVSLRSPTLQVGSLPLVPPGKDPEKTESRKRL